ncbi:MAG: hypothetical protein ATN35_07420 [Epulopiscium sp. Nele67-Bin004]|nr:MAG: hypothetical protein ATN35_07420 [Epulopiscium sp. Nele67-Bin004]
MQVEQGARDRARERETERERERERQREREPLNGNKRKDRKRACSFPTPLNVFLFVPDACLITGII